LGLARPVDVTGTYQDLCYRRLRIGLFSKSLGRLSLPIRRDSPRHRLSSMGRRRRIGNRDDSVSCTHYRAIGFSRVSRRARLLNVDRVQIENTTPIPINPF
jgi:hypothetical protein